MGLLEPIVTPASCLDHIGQLWPRQAAASSDDSGSVGVSVGLPGTGISIGASTTGGGTSTTSINTGTSSSSGLSDSSGSSSTTVSGTSLTTSSSSITTTSSSDSSSTTSFGSSSSSDSSSSSSLSNTGTTLDLVSSSSSLTSSSSTSSSPTPTSTPSSSITTSESSTDTITSAPASFSSSASSVSFTTIFTTERNGTVISTVVPVLGSQAPATLSSASRKGMIAGGAVGGSLLILVIAVLVSLFCWRRRKNRKLGFLDALVRKSKEGKGAGGVGLLDGEFEDDEEYRDEMQMRGVNVSSHSQQSSLSDPAINPQHNSNYPYNTAPTLYRAHASNSGSFFREEGVWPPPGDGFVDPFVPARELKTNSDLHGIVDQVMGPASTSLPPGAAPSTAPGTTGRDVMGHGKQNSGGSLITTPKISSPLALNAGDRTSLADSIADSTIFSGSPPPGASAQPKNWLERQPKTPSPRNATFTLPTLGSNGGSAAAPPSAFANSASSLAHTYGTSTNAETQRHSQRISWGDLPTPSRPGSRQGSTSTLGAGVP